MTRASLAPLARASTGLVLAVTLVPARALACAVCAGGNPANRFAFFASTIVLSLLPLGLFVCAFLWLRSRRKAEGSSEFVERDAADAARRPALVEASPGDPEALHSPPTPAR